MGRGTQCHGGAGMSGLMKVSISKCHRDQSTRDLDGACGCSSAMVVLPFLFPLRVSLSPSQVVSENRNAGREESRPIPKHPSVALSSHCPLFCFFFSLAELNRDE